MTKTKDIQAGERTQYTPGPWAVNPTGDIGPWTVGNRETEIANCAGSDVPQLEMEANARLIAATPELLEALDELAQAFAHNIPHVTQRPAYLRAKAAIAKAEGGDS